VKRNRWEGKSMRRILAYSVVLGLMLALVAAAPVSAGTRTAVTMTVTTTFGQDANPFTATGLPGCSSGLVYEGGANFVANPSLGVFAGYKVFDCGGDGNADFVVRLNARFGPFDPIGTWAVVAGWGDFASMSGAGRLTGDPFGDGIGVVDNYFGTITL
jgi:hypothetical protein